MAAHATDVSVVKNTDYNTGGGSLTINTPSGMNDGVGLIVIAAVEGTDGNRDIDSVKLHSSTQPVSDLDFIKIGEIDGDDTGASNQDQRLTVWKLDNQAFGTTTEGHYDEVVIAFESGASARYGLVYIVSNQMGADMVRNWEEGAIDDTTGDHTITDFVLEPDAMIISAHFWKSGNSPTVTPQETSDWNQNNTTTGLVVQRDVPDDATDKAMTVNFKNLAGGDTAADSLNVAVVLRSDTDIVHTPDGTPGTLGDATSGGYWLEGVTAHPDTVNGGDRGDISDWGVSHTGKATWLRGAICDGNTDGDNLLLVPDEPPGSSEKINIMNFSPLNADREEEFDNYIAGVEAELDASVESNGTHRHIGTLFLNDWADYTGMVVWDLEQFCLDYGGARGHQDSTNWGPMDTYDVTDADPDVPEWEYNAATRYYWERVHQWFVEVYAPKVEALVFYMHPQGPDVSEGLSTDWWGDDGNGNGIYDNAGEEWQKDIEWVYTMQGAFDGHCYPPIDITDNDLHTWVTNTLENFRVIYEEFDGRAIDLYCYVTHWPSRPKIDAYQDGDAVGIIIDADNDIRTRTMDPWSNFDTMYLGVVPVGLKWDDTFEIVAVDSANLIVTVDGKVANKFDPGDPTVDIDGSTNETNDGTYDFGQAVVSGPDTEVYLTSGTLTEGLADYGDLLAPAKTATDFKNWWEGTFVVKWDDYFGQ